MNKNKGRNRKQKPNKKYYKLVQSDLFIRPHKERNHSLEAMKEISKYIGKDGKYLYIDLNDDKGFNFMEECSQSQPDQQAQQLGDNFVSQLENSSKGNSKAVAYLFQAKKQNFKNSLIMDKMSGELRKSRDRLDKQRSKNNSRLSQQEAETEPRVHVYRGMDKALIDKIRMKEEYDQLSKMVKKRQSTLMEKYNTITTHRSRIVPTTDLRSSDRNSQMRLNSFLPYLSSIRILKA